MAKSGSKLLLAGMVGLAAGIGIGMLFAPAKGSKTRKRLKKRIMGFADMMQDDLSDKINAMKSVFGSEEENEPVEEPAFQQEEDK